MRIVHLADLHLGYRQYDRLTPGGINQREADVAATFSRAIDAIIELAPDVVLVAGDVFHSVRPTNAAILHAFTQFSRLNDALPGTRVIIVAGNHDTPRSSETGGILGLLKRTGATVIERGATLVELPELDLAVLAVAETGERPRLMPDSAYRHNVLLLHGAVLDAIPPQPGEPPPDPLERRDLNADRWSYVALGHYHSYHEVSDNAWYAGSIDYTSLDIWGDLRRDREAQNKGKGFIEVDLDTGTHTFHKLEPSRTVVDLKPVNAANLAAADIDEAIRKSVERLRSGIEGCIVRLRVSDLPLHIARELDHGAIREYKRRALHFHFDTSRPEKRSASASGAPGKRRSLTDYVRENLSSRTIDPSVDRARLVDQGVHYLEAAEQDVVVTALPATAPIAAE